MLEKTIKDAMKDRKRSMGSKQVLGSMKNSKLIVISQSVPKTTVENIQESAKKQNVPTLNFEGSSVALGRLAGLQFRVSAISLTSVSDANIKSILKESASK